MSGSRCAWCRTVIYGFAASDNGRAAVVFETEWDEGGLSAFGRGMVRGVNRLGVPVDLSHVAATTCAPRF